MKRRRPYPVPPAAGHPSRAGRGEANGGSRGGFRVGVRRGTATSPPAPLRTRRGENGDGGSCGNFRVGVRQSEAMKRRRPYPVPPAAGHPSRAGRGEANGGSRGGFRVGVRRGTATSPPTPLRTRRGENGNGRGRDARATRRFRSGFLSSSHAGFRQSEAMKRRRPYPVPPAAGHPSRAGRGEANGGSLGSFRVGVRRSEAMRTALAGETPAPRATGLSRPLHLRDSVTGLSRPLHFRDGVTGFSRPLHFRDRQR
jgi:hypothetical protein